MSMPHSSLDTRVATARLMRTVKQIGVVVLSLLVVTAWLTAILLFWFRLDF